jgi:DNA-binding NarL/FixJ family response regulator
MHRIILADQNVVFRAATARVLTTDENIDIVALCDAPDELYRAAEEFPGATVLFAASLQPDFARLLSLLERSGSRSIVIGDDGDCVWTYLDQGFNSVVFRYTSAASLMKSVREVAQGAMCIPVPIIGIDSAVDCTAEMSIHARIRFNHIRFPAYNTKRNAC